MDFGGGWGGIVLSPLHVICASEGKMKIATTTCSIVADNSEIGH